MGFFDDLLSGVGDFLSGGAGGQLLASGANLLSPAVSEWLYGNADPSDLLTPEQIEAINLSNEARRFQLGAANQALPYATPEAQEAIVSREAARHGYESDLVRRRQVSRGVRSPFTSNTFDNIDPIVRRALSLSDPTSRALNVLNQAGATAAGIPGYTGPGDVGALARGEDLYRQGQVEQAASNILPAINLLFNGGQQSPQVSGFFRGMGSSGGTGSQSNPYYGLLI